MSSFGPAGTLGVAYEVPNLIQVPIEGTNQRKWVLLVGINQARRWAEAPLSISSEILTVAASRRTTP